MICGIIRQVELPVKPTTTLIDFAQPLASVTTALKVAVSSPLLVREVGAPGSAQKTVKGEVPPVTSMVMPPSCASGQVVGVTEGSSTMSEGSAIVILPVAEHKFASVTVTIYAPAASPDAVAAVCIGDELHEFVHERFRRLHGCPPAAEVGTSSLRSMLPPIVYVQLCSKSRSW